MKEENIIPKGGILLLSDNTEIGEAGDTATPNKLNITFEEYVQLIKDSSSRPLSEEHLKSSTGYRVFYVEKCSFPIDQNIILDVD
jgi:hypothetical protein